MQVVRIDREDIHVGIDVAHQLEAAVLGDHGAVRLQLGHVARQGRQLLLGGGKVQGGGIALAEGARWVVRSCRHAAVGIAHAVHGRTLDAAFADIQAVTGNQCVDGAAGLLVRADTVVIQVDIAASGQAATDAGKAAGVAAADVAEDEGRVAVGNAEVNHGRLGRGAEGESEQGGADERQGA